MAVPKPTPTPSAHYRGTTGIKPEKSIVESILDTARLLAKGLVPDPPPANPTPSRPVAGTRPIGIGAQMNEADAIENKK